MGQEEQGLAGSLDRAPIPSQALGVMMESVPREQFYAHARGGIVLRYAHRNPDTARFTTLRVECGSH